MYTYVDSFFCLLNRAIYFVRKIIFCNFAFLFREDSNKLDNNAWLNRKKIRNDQRL